ncbi:amino acid adenylation domain-containing protein [Scytonema tolypothrichoides VB-61278]|nr:amino acid adenylation domain-containing protein [Scytonema tolypothrichoides VB-61278]
MSNSLTEQYLYFQPNIQEDVPSHKQLVIELSASASVVTCKAELPLPQQELPVKWQPGVHTMFSQQAQRVPQQIAVVDGQVAWTYAELEERANQLAHYLLANNIQSQNVVAIYGYRSVELVWAILGVLKAGAAFIILDPAYPTCRLIDCLQQVSLHAWVQIAAAGELPATLSEYVATSSSHCRLQLSFDSTTILQDFTVVDPEVTVDPDNLAYVAFTSGSTGKPKGIKGTHRPLSHFLQWHGKTFGFSEVDRFSMLSGLSHDPLLRDIFTPLSLGATLCIPKQRDIETPGELASWMRCMQISVAHLTPAMAQLLTVNANSHTTDLRYVFFAGDVLTQQDVTRIRNFAPNATCVNFYGATETPQAMGYFQIPNRWALPSVINSNPILEGEEISVTQTIPVGRGIEDVQLLVLTSKLQLAGILEVGEIFVRTPYLASGYIGNEELTSERFIINPFTNIATDKLYKTGDLGRYLSDGNIEFIGRSDHQVKIRGFRIELGEIEATLGKHPRVQQTLVLAREDVPGDKRLVAYVVVHPQQLPPSPSELYRFLQDKLPDYMLPKAFVFLDTLPLTPNGKVDRRALPAPDTSHGSSANSYVPPRNPTEEVLAAIWAQVLGLEQVGIDNNFFELGGHSLLAMQVMSRIRQAFGVEISLQSLFETPTIAQLASAITTSLNQETQEHQTISRQTNRQSIPLSFAQARLWFLAQLEPDSAAYNVVDAMQLQGNLNVDVLQQSLDAIATHHEVLRTNFIVEDGNPVQVIREPQSVELKVISLMDCPETERATVVQKLLQHEAQRPFNLSSDLMLRACLLEISPQEHILQLTIHHIATDGWSMSILFEQLATLYQAFLEGKPNPLPEQPIQYADYAVWQRQWLCGEVVENQLNYWKQQLAGATPVLELPTDKPRPPVQTRRGAKQSFVLPKNLSASLSALSRQEGVTLFMTLLAAFQTLLYRYSGQQDILVGSPTAGRNREEIEGLIGFFVNTLVLRTDLSGNPKFRELLQRVRSHAMSAYANQDLPFDKLVEELQPERSLSYHPLFQVMFVLQNVPTQTLELPGVSISTIEVDNSASQFDITLSIEETEQGLRGLWEYSTDLFDADTITRMSGHFQTLLEEVTANPQQHVNELPLLTATEKQQLLEWNDTQAEYQEQCIHQLFEQQVEKTPHAVAVMFEGEELTYQQLNIRANQLAHYLKTLGVGADVLVGICMERSLEMVVGLLGILKAGGAYVPIDPAYPKERLTFILEDTQTPVMLTQEKLLHSLQNLGSQVICLDSDWELIANNSQENPVCEATVDDLMYVIYTSGSTGKPKGVMVPHRGISNQLHWRQATFKLTEQDKVLQTISLSFDPSVWQIFWPLLFGGQLIMARPDGHRDPAYMVKMIIEQQITVAALVPSIIRVLLEEKGIENCTSLKHVTSGGEALPVELIERFVERLKLENVLINCYGPTEASIDTTFWTCQQGTDYTIAPIGRAIANVQVYILDDNLQPVPVGQSGELYIGGTGLARGYLNRPELTAQKFIHNPFSSEPGARLYKTGDLVRYLSDGNIEFLNRIDYQVKIRGFRIELGEIEATLGEYPGVQQTLVSIREDVPGDKRLVAYIVAEQVPPSASELRDFLQGKLPEYMVPKAFVFLDVMPLNPNGKVDRRALDALDLDFQEAQATFVAPRNELERQIAEIWEEILGQAVGIRDNFFDLGGHSLLAVKLFAQIEKKFGFRLPLATLFTANTVESLAKMLCEQQRKAIVHQVLGPAHEEDDSVTSGSCLVPIQPKGSKPPFFCIHPLGGEILCYRPLALHLGQDQPFYGIQPQGLDGKLPPLNRIEDMAALYIQEIKTIQPTGPYFLGGYSLGGMIAYEMAQQLYSQGETVDILAMLDTCRPGSTKRSSFLKRMLLHFENLLQQGPTYLSQKLVGWSLWGKYTVQEKYMRVLGIKEPLTEDDKHIEIMNANVEALSTYIFQSYPGPMLLLRTSDKSRTDAVGDQYDPQFGWGELVTGGVDTHQIPGSHLSFLHEPNVRVLAEKLKEYLEKRVAVSHT